jgi:flagellin
VAPHDAARGPIAEALQRIDSAADVFDGRCWRARLCVRNRSSRRMSIGVNYSLASIRSLSALRTTQQLMSTAARRLATGYRINTAADGPAGLIAVQNLSQEIVQIAAQQSAGQRAGDDASAAEARVAQYSDLLIQAKSLTLQNANDAGLSDDERAANQVEMDSILASIDRLNRTPGFGADTAQQVVSSTLVSTAGAAQHATGAYTLADVRSGGRLDAASDNAADADKLINKAIGQVLDARGRLGAFTRYTVTPIDNVLDVTRQNLLAARSQIQDTDYAAEAVNYFRAQRLSRVNIAALGYSRRQSARVLDLLA